MKIKAKITETREKTIGYTCDICKKETIYNITRSNEESTIKWSHPVGGWGERDETDTIMVCSMRCLFKALKGVYFGADIRLSYEFLESFRNEGVNK